MHTDKEQNGFAHIGLMLMAIVVVVLIVAVGFVVTQRRPKSSQDSNKSQPTTSVAQEEPAISLQNVGLASMNSVLVTQDALREYDSMGLKGFYPFGDKLGGKTDTRLNPNFEFSSLKPGTKVISAIDGTVSFIKVQTDSNDSEVFIQPKEGSQWTVGYDHIKNLTVKKGDSIKAGAVIGEPAVQGNGALRFEIQINKDESGVTTHICPSTLLSEGVKSTVLGELAQMQQAWNTTTNRKLYDLSAQDPTGCLKKTMSVAEAEGR